MIAQELINEVSSKVHAEYEFIEREDSDWGSVPVEAKDSFGELDICSYCEPEDAIWHRDLSRNFETGLKLGIRNTLKVIKDNPELLKRLLD